MLASRPVQVTELSRPIIRVGWISAKQVQLGRIPALL